jgi:hypothetical protein
MASIVSSAYHLNGSIPIKSREQCQSVHTLLLKRMFIECNGSRSLILRRKGFCVSDSEPESEQVLKMPPMAIEIMIRAAEYYH